MKKSWLQMLPLIVLAMAPTISWAAPENPPAITLAPLPEPAEKISVTIIGGVTHSGTFQLPGDATFLSALRAAGGLNKINRQIDLSNIKVMRKGQTLTVNMSAMFKGDYAQNLRLQDHDLIIIADRPAELAPPAPPIIRKTQRPAPDSVLPDLLRSLSPEREQTPPNARGFSFNGMTVYIVPLQRSK